jgi:uncharacterized membrane protein YphA (DoxX/SURF4 family)
MDLYTIIILFTGVSFVAYGINSFISKRMIREFNRWGLADKRKAIGASQFVGGLGLLVGFEFELALVISSVFIIVMMFVAIAVRIRIKDNISDILPAITYILLNAIILYRFLYA